MIGRYNPRFICLDCGMNTITEYYMVFDNIWNSVAGHMDGMLCIGCLEKRLGRKLTKKDFPDFPINTWSDFSRSDRLNNRLHCSEYNESIIDDDPYTAGYTDKTFGDQ
jgi:hypothetical protein